MTITDIVRMRLQNERLSGKPFDRPEDVVRWFGAVQSQDYYGAKWGVGQRIKNCVDSDLDAAFNAGKILRTHVMRPTWHFVMPEDIRWMLELTGPRIESFCQYYYRKIGLDSKTLQKSNALLAKTLPGKQCTRAELKQTFEAANIDTSGLRLGFLVMHAELSALICSGALRGKQHTYTLLEERAPKARSLPRDEALAELTKRYFTSHGPAQVQDFAWWSGLTVGDAKKGLDIVTPELLHETVDGKAFWFAPNKAIPAFTSPLVQLLPNYDEFLGSYKDHVPSMRPDIVLKPDRRSVVFANHIIVLDGTVVGGWRRELKKNEVLIEATLLKRLTAAERHALESAAADYGHFLQLNPKMEIAYE